MNNGYCLNNKINELNIVKLSICIPTFNRATCLQSTLSQLVDQISHIEGRSVEVLIGDNHSDDDTEIIGQQYSDKYPYISYCRHSRNIGQEMNSENLVQKAKGGFIWLLSDDDYIEDGAVEKIVQVISQQDVEFIFINYTLWSNDLQKYLGPSRCIAVNDCATNNGDEFYSLVRYANTFVSSCIFKLTQWNAKSPTQYHGSKGCWVHLHVANKIILRDKCYIIAAPLMRMRCLDPMASRMERKKHGNDHYYMDAFITFLDFVKNQGVSITTQNIGNDLIIKDNFFQIVIYKCVAEKYDIKYLFRILEILSGCSRLRKSVAFWVRDIPVLFLPQYCAKLVYEWWKLKQQVANWKGSQNKYQRFLYIIFTAVRQLKRRIQVNFGKIDASG